MGGLIDLLFSVFFAIVTIILKVVFNIAKFVIRLAWMIVCYLATLIVKGVRYLYAKYKEYRAKKITDIEKALPLSADDPSFTGNEYDL
jgi:hypothetical protein